ncbi:MAG: DUF6691 family protein [Gammaproteobacteria bacterium]
MGKLLSAALAGALFGAGLTLAGMVNPLKVLNFLDLAGDWDPSLALVMGAGLAVTLISFRWVLARPQPIVAAQFNLPVNKQIDSRLLAGAALFGLGWGLAGYCPGPAIAALSFGTSEPWIFVAAMLAGSLAGRCLDA